MIVVVSIETDVRYHHTVHSVCQVVKSEGPVATSYLGLLGGSISCIVQHYRRARQRTVLRINYHSAYFPGAILCLGLNDHIERKNAEKPKSELHNEIISAQNLNLKN